MKKVFALFAVAGMLFTASCGNKEANDETQDTEIIIEETEEVDATTDTVDVVIIEETEVEEVEVETEN